MRLKKLSNNFRNIAFLLSMFFAILTSAQNQKTVFGTVMADGAPLPGASVIVKGTTNGTATDFDGKFSLSVSSSATTLEVSYLGYVTQEVAITSGEITVVLVAESNALDEVIINVGYGSQKKSVVTGAISSVKAKDLEKVPAGRVENALQGKTSGVVIASNAGQPGSAATVRVRGVTTFDTNGGNNPIWVVDGVIMSSGELGSINQSDIESVEVLKDAASLAIYGARAASGVILVTTKKGKLGKVNFSYTGSASVQTPSKMLNLLNATQYAAIMNEKAAAAGQTIPYQDLSLYGKGTDWQKVIFNNALKYSNEFVVNGGSEKSTFYFSLGNLSQDGIVMKEISTYDRYNVRVNSDHKLKDWLTIGEKIGYSHQKAVGLGNTNSEYGGPLSSAINLDPITPIVETDPTIANGTKYSNEFVLRDENGNPYGISDVVGQEMTNPLAYAKTRLGQFAWSDDFLGNMYFEIQPVEFIKFKTSLGAKMAYWGNEGFNPKYYLSPTVNSTAVNSLYRNQFRNLNWNVENTLTFEKVFDKHNVNLLLGQGAYVDNEIYQAMNVTVLNLPTNDYQEASFNDYTLTDDNDDGYTYNGYAFKLTSLFARLMYNYDEKYLFTGIIRRDGSSRFGDNYKYGYFPSFSLGWVVSKESFWKQNDAISTLKIRGGYGKTGNSALGDFSYVGVIDGGYNYTWFDGNTVSVGATTTRIPNPDLHWEETAQTNIGFETKLFKDFNLTFDWYKKNTTGILRENPVPGYVGAEQPPIANIADMKNSGIEIELGYVKSIHDFNLSASANFSTNKNEITYLGYDIESVYDNAAGFQSMGSITISKVGEAYNSFYGYQTDGIFQNWAEVEAYTNGSGEMIQPDAVPGDFRWKDNNGDGQISDLDKVILGTSIPKMTFGFTINLDYKNFDLMALANGVAGNKIFQGLRRLDILNANYQTNVLSRWTGEGTSNDYPRLTNQDTNGNFTKMSDFYLEKGDYLKIKSLQLGYTVIGKESSKLGFEKMRVYIAGENLFTFTNYTGYDPEIGGNVMGIDRGYYPQAKTYSAGINIQF